MLLLLTAALASPPIQDIDDARYVLYNRPQPVLEWVRTEMEAKPDDVSTMLLWLDTLVMLPHAADRAVVLQQTRRWALQHEDDLPAAKVVWVRAMALHSMRPDYASSRIWGERGDWCDEAWALLQPEDYAGEDLRRVMAERRQHAGSCGWDVPPNEFDAYARTRPEGDYLRAYYLLDRVDEGEPLPSAEVDSLVAAVTERPHRLEYAGRFMKTEAAPELLAVADSVMTSERPSLVFVTTYIYRAAKDRERLLAAMARLDELDPDHDRHYLKSIRFDETEAEVEREQRPSTIIDPEARLAALEAQAVPKGAWRASHHHLALADAMEALEREEESLDALVAAWKQRATSGTGIRIVRKATRLGTHTRMAKRIANILIARSEQPDLVFGSQLAQSAADHRRALADALYARAELWLSLDRVDLALDDARNALSFDATLVDALLLVGLHTDGHDALQALTTGVALGSGAQDEQARQRLATAIDAGEIWSPDGLFGHIEAARAALDVPETTRALPDLGTLPDLPIQWKGERSTLAGIEGPAVIEFWATWCGPCLQALPHLDALARRHPDMRFVALSVDKERPTAEEHFAEETQAFRLGWVGADAMNDLGIRGIPAAFVIDAEGRIRANIRGYGPGNTAIDEAIAALHRESP